MRLCVCLYAALGVVVFSIYTYKVNTVHKLTTSNSLSFRFVCARRGGPELNPMLVSLAEQNNIPCARTHAATFILYAILCAQEYNIYLRKHSRKYLYSHTMGLGCLIVCHASPLYICVIVEEMLEANIPENRT